MPVRNKKILFINPPWYRLQGLVSTYPPMGSLYIAGLLEKSGYECVVWNADYSDKASGVSEGSSTNKMCEMNRRYNDYLSTLNNLNHAIWQEVREVIDKQKPDVLGLVVYTASVGSAKNMARIAKELNKDIKLICGGPHATVLPEELINDENVDFVVQGEGEYATLNILNNIENCEELSKIKGMYYKDNGNVIFTGERTKYEDLNNLPMPAKHLLIDKEKLPSVVFQPIFTTRGCPYKCIYCTTHKIHGYKTRTIDHDVTFHEIETLQRNFNVHHFFICDDTFGQDIDHTTKFLKKIIDKKLNITWGCQTRGEKLTEELVSLMKKAGCTQVSIGVETGSPRIRKLIKKGNTVEDIVQASRLLRKYKIEIATFFMFGFPGETLEDVKMSLNLLDKIQPYTAHCNIVTPDPGTELYEILKERGQFTGKIDWSTFFHQNPDLFSIEGLSKEESRKLIDDIQRHFDRFNKKKQRIDLMKRLPLYLNILYKEKLYKHPSYLLNKLKDLV
jgi:radical SAM superfamily enzyme YgiQ (UPF0313 family)